MKKRMLAVAFAIVLACGAAGCGNQEAETKEPVEETQATTAEAKEEEMLAYLKEQPAEIPAETATEAGFFTIKDGAVVGGQEAWDAFLEASEAGQEASVVVCQYTQWDGAVLDYLYYSVETGYLLVTDETRGGYESEDEDRDFYYTRTFEVLKTFADFALSEGSTPHTICVLTNEAEMDEDTFRTYWTEMSMEAHQTMLLYVI